MTLTHSRPEYLSIKAEAPRSAARAEIGPGINAGIRTASDEPPSEKEWITDIAAWCDALRQQEARAADLPAPTPINTDPAALRTLMEQAQRLHWQKGARSRWQVPWICEVVSCLITGTAPGQSVVRLYVTQGALASVLGCTRRTVVRALAWWKSEGSRLHQAHAQPIGGQAMYDGSLIQLRGQPAEEGSEAWLAQRAPRPGFAQDIGHNSAEVAMERALSECGSERLVVGSLLLCLLSLSPAAFFECLAGLQPRATRPRTSQDAQAPQSTWPESASLKAAEQAPEQALSGSWVATTGTGNGQVAPIWDERLWWEPGEDLLALGAAYGSWLGGCPAWPLLIAPERLTAYGISEAQLWRGHFILPPAAPDDEQLLELDRRGEARVTLQRSWAELPEHVLRRLQGLDATLRSKWWAQLSGRPLRLASVEELTCAVVTSLRAHGEDGPIDWRWIPAPHGKGRSLDAAERMNAGLSPETERWRRPIQKGPQCSPGTEREGSTNDSGAQATGAE